MLSVPLGEFGKPQWAFSMILYCWWIPDENLWFCWAPLKYSRKLSGAGDSGHEKTTVTSPTATLTLWIPENPPWSPDSQHSDCVLQQSCALTLHDCPESGVQFPNYSITRGGERHIFSLKSCLNLLPLPSLDMYLTNLLEHFVWCCFLAFIWGK